MVFAFIEYSVDRISCLQVKYTYTLKKLFIVKENDKLFFILCRYRNRPVMSGPGLYDPTSIMNAGRLNFYFRVFPCKKYEHVYKSYFVDTLSKCQREGWIKLAVYLLSFFYYLYG